MKNSWYSHQKIIKGTGEFGNNRTRGDRPNYSIIEIGQNTEKNPGDLRRLVASQVSSERPSALADVKNSQGVTITIIIIIVLEI